MRWLRHFLAAAIAVALLTVLAASSAFAAETKTVYGLKDCNTSPSPPAPGGFCLITQSSLKILEGAKVYYTDASVVAGVLKSPVTLRATDKQLGDGEMHVLHRHEHRPLCVYEWDR
jgi:hypothetical protein